MGEFQTTLNLKRIKNLAKKVEDISRPIDKKTAENVGKAIVNTMLDEIGDGNSPITGKKFPKYKNPSKYPGSRKPKSPVNLELTGQFLDALKYRVNNLTTGWSTTIGYLNSKKAQLKESGHREGVNGQPKRPTIPTSAEGFSAKIRKAFIKIYSDRISKLTK